jgi:hypothetical protein
MNPGQGPVGAPLADFAAALPERYSLTPPRPPAHVLP